MKNKGYAKFREGGEGGQTRYIIGDVQMAIEKLQEIIHVILTVSMQSCQWEMRTGLS